MKHTWNAKDLFLRILAISLTSIVLLFISRDSRFDLHFKIRKAQPTSADILVVEAPPDFSTDSMIKKLLKKGIKELYVSHFIFEQPSDKIKPYIVGDLQDNLLSLAFKPDQDGLIRRVRFLSSKLAPFPSSSPDFNINFRGPENTFPSISFYDLQSDDVELGGKIIILKSTNAINSYTTPLGLLSEAELMATVIDNKIENRFIPNKKVLTPILILALLLVLTTLFLIYLPSTLALLSTLGLTVAYVSLSLWIFDTFCFWTPITVPLVQILLTFLLISNYKFVLNEKTRWGLEKESLFLNQVEEMKTNFLSLFSHDLKTPLAKIIGIVDTLQSKVDDPEISMELQKIQDSSKELDKYIKRILKMSQVQSRNMSLNKKPVDLNQLIEQSIQQVQYMAQKKNMTIEKKLAPLFMLDLDAPLIKEVVVNFLENAITYSPNGRTVTVISEELSEYIKFSVIDQGKGIPKEVQGQVWEKSFRFDTQQPGYGLGLFLSRYVVTLHGGQVFLNSQENSGSEFGFLLPLDEDNS